MKRFIPRYLEAIVLVAVGAVTGANLLAQSPEASAPRFEVALVKATLSPFELGREAGRLAAAGGSPPLMLAIGFGILTYPGGRLTATGTPAIADRAGV